MHTNHDDRIDVGRYGWRAVSSEYLCRHDTTNANSELPHRLSMAIERCGACVVGRSKTHLPLCLANGDGLCHLARSYIVGCHVLSSFHLRLVHGSQLCAAC